MKQRILMLSAISLLTVMVGCTTAPPKHTASYDASAMNENNKRYNDDDTDGAAPTVCLLYTSDAADE